MAAENPWGALPIACCIYCRRDSRLPHLPWCRWDLWRITQPDPAAVRRAKGAR